MLQEQSITAVGTGCSRVLCSFCGTLIGLTKVYHIHNTSFFLMNCDCTLGVLVLSPICQVLTFTKLIVSAIFFFRRLIVFCTYIVARKRRVQRGLQGLLGNCFFFFCVRDVLGLRSVRRSTGNIGVPILPFSPCRAEGTIFSFISTYLVTNFAMP